MSLKSAPEEHRDELFSISPRERDDKVGRKEQAELPVSPLPGGCRETGPEGGQLWRGHSGRKRYPSPLFERKFLKSRNSQRQKDCKTTGGGRISKGWEAGLQEDWKHEQSF